MKHAQTQHRPKRYGNGHRLGQVHRMQAPAWWPAFRENNVPFREDESDKPAEHHLDEGLQGHQRVKSSPKRKSVTFPGPASTAPASHEGPLPLRIGLPGHGHRLQQRDRHRQPDLYPLFRLPLLHGGLPVPCTLFQLVGSGLAQRHGKIPEPQRLPAHARHRGKMQLLFPSLSTGPG